MRVQARGPAAGAGAKWTLPFTGWEPINFHVNDDGFDYFNFNNMNGIFILNHLSFGIGIAGYAFNVGFGDINIIENTGGITGGGAGVRRGTVVEGGFFTVVGSANIVNIDIDSCGECDGQ